MESGVCEVCGRKGYVSGCILCDKKVCDSCIDPMKGICIACKREAHVEFSGEGMTETD